MRPPASPPLTSDATGGVAIGRSGGQRGCASACPGRSDARRLGLATLDLGQLPRLLALLCHDGSRHGFVLQPLALHFAQAFDLCLGIRLESNQLDLLRLERDLGVVELALLVAQPCAGLVVVVERRRTRLGDDRREHAGLQLFGRAAQIGENRNAGRTARDEPVDRDQFDRPLQLLDLVGEVAQLHLQAFLLEQQQLEARFGGEVVLGGLIGTITRGSDLAHSLLSCVVIGLGAHRGSSRYEQCQADQHQSCPPDRRLHGRGAYRALQLGYEHPRR